jgi:potassium efflux system protein
VKINAFATELDELIANQRRGILFDTSPLMFSSRYLSQYSGDLWVSLQRGVDEMTWADSRFVTQEGWIGLIQGVLSLAAIVAVYRNRQTLKASARWQFLTARPFSAGLFFFCIPAILLYEYEGASDIGTLAIRIVAGICLVRLAGVMIEASWKRQFVYGLVIVFIATRLMDLVGFPPPLFRLYTVLAALIGFLFCWRCTREIARQGEPGFYAGLLRLGSLLFLIIMISEFWGQTSLASYLFLSLTHTIIAVVTFMVFIRMIHGCVEWLFGASLLGRAAVLYGDTDVIIRRITQFINIAMWGLFLVPLILMVLGVYDSLEEAIGGSLKLGFNWGSQRISVGLVIVALGIVYGSFLVSWIVQKLFNGVVLRSRQVDRGVRYSMDRLIHYVIIVIGFLIALSTLGFEATKITIVLSALGVGIGFGLQGAVNNFVSGLILLFERPVRVGDTIEIGGKWAEIHRIGLRSTTVKTLDEADVIIPNSDLISNQVTNWTLTNRLVRLTIPVGVAYGSDVPLVLETLTACSRDRDRVATYPAPQVLFLKFGESSLDFELRVWVTDADHRLKVTSELHQEIDRRFREANIVIAFPQRDLHLQSPDESVVLKSSLRTDK